MFTINVWPLLDTYPGDSQSLAFEGEVLPDLYEDLRILGPLKFTLTLIAIEDGVEAIIRGFDAKVEYEGNPSEVHIAEVARTFKKTYDPLAPDDVGFIDPKSSTIDLAKVIREEILIQIL